MGRCQAAHRAICGEGLVRPVRIGDALLLGSRSGALAQPCHADGNRQRCVDARVGGERCRVPRPACRTLLIALGRPLAEACQAEVVLAWRLRKQDGGCWHCRCWCAMGGGSAQRGMGRQGMFCDACAVRAAHRHGPLTHFQADSALQCIVVQQIRLVIFGWRGGVGLCCIETNANSIRCLWTCNMRTISICMSS